MVRQLWFIDGFTLEVANLSEGNGVGSKASLENSPKQILCKVSYKSNSMEKVLDWLNKECESASKDRTTELSSLRLEEIVGQMFDGD